ncbi:MAG: hypothetical protein M3P98_00270 [bacterium]|nr:hypothetical protein [bacterium]
MTKDFASAKRENRRSVTIWLYVFAVLIAFVGFVVWYAYVFSSPERTFWSTVDANLNVSSYSKVVVQEQPGSKGTNVTTFEDGVTPIARDVGILTTGEGESTINQETESIGVEGQNYFTYKRVDGKILNSAGEPVDTSSVVGVAGVMDLNSPLSQGFPQTLRDARVGPQLTLPFANLGSEQRSDLISFMQDSGVFKVDFNNVSKSEVNGKTAYKYDVEINIEKYIELLQKLDELNGTEFFAGIDPAQANGQTANVIMSIDINARQLLELEYSGTGAKETISGYNGHYNIKKPTEFVEFNELNNRIRELLQ